MMADITKCGTAGCPLAGKCYRKTAPDTSEWQSYAFFIWSDKGGKIECSHFWDREP